MVPNVRTSKTAAKRGGRLALNREPVEFQGQIVPYIVAAPGEPRRSAERLTGHAEVILILDLPYHWTERCTTRVRYTLQGEPFADSSRNFIVQSHRLAGIVLPEGFATRRLPQLLRPAF